MLLGNRVFLRGMEEKDIPHKVKWINDNEVRKTLNFDYPISEISTKQWLNKITSDNSRKEFIICLLESEKPIGYTGLLDINNKSSKAEMYIGIGEKEYWGKGYAKESRKVLLEYAFMEIGLNKIYTYNWVNNEKIIGLNKKLGFQIEGILRKDIFSHGEFRDRIIMGILRNEYIENFHNNEK
ncbi:GNAT family N-acetyltransferase [Clostridium sp. D2Q-11]|uniref:GNAT family N-acetyltransferase n=1 Tax=Anaeromonas frigoriresistens TaxID=2683708 RepID=A0A942Z9F4_9FIRM|nr:GNAT family N-acetyltransferase [Anaeromonas frigoriresistens]